MKNKTNNEFGSFVLDDAKLKKYMHKKVFAEYINLKKQKLPLTEKCADAIAFVIKKWAIKMGAECYTHWFCPLNTLPVEKRTYFLEKNKQEQIVKNFSGKELLKTEVDASSFPNGNQRSTFEARGYVIWDYTSPIFIKEDLHQNKLVCIPAIFCSYNGEALDEKTPLLRASQLLSEQVVKLLNKLGYQDVTRTELNVGAEQEYFLFDKNFYRNQSDLKVLGHSLLDVEPLKWQKNGTDYLKRLNDNVSDYLQEVYQMLFKMGIAIKLQHSEVSPCQYEIVPIFNNANISTDQNYIIMEVLERLAEKYGYIAFFGEKPYDNLNGSGKHENWSIITDTGINLFDMTIQDKLLFATFFTSMIVAVDKYYPLLRWSTAYYSNDLRLGGKEAPPSTISIFTGDYVLDFVKKILADKNESYKKMQIDSGVKFLPKIEKDFCDRNRTSPLAFTGNKFEFRMVGASQSVALPSTIICAMMSDVVMDINSELKNSVNVRQDLKKILSRLLKNHSRIIFNGNGYDESWRVEARAKGLVEYKDSLSTFSVLESKKMLDFFERTKIFSKKEIIIRKNVCLNEYFSTLLLNAKFLIQSFNKQNFFLKNFTRKNGNKKLKIYFCQLKELVSKFDKNSQYKNKKVVSKIKWLMDKLILGFKSNVKNI